MIPRPLQFRVLDDLQPLTWSEICYGYSHRLLGWRTVVDLAIKKLEDASSNPLEVELAGVGKDQAGRVGELLSELSATEPKTDECSKKRRWLFITLKWLYENRPKFADPFGEIEEIYADFQYPPEISHFVRFLPATGGYRPEQHTREENIQRLFDLWHEYLTSSAQSHPRSTP